MAEPKVNINENDFEMSLREVEALNDEELYDKLVMSGKEIGPVVATTRRLYQKQLATIISSPAPAPMLNGTSRCGSSLLKKSEIPPAVVSFSASSFIEPDERSGVDQFQEFETPKKLPFDTSSTYSTPNRSPKTFDEYVAESEARMALQYLKWQQSQKKASIISIKVVQPSQLERTNLKLFLLIAVFAVVAAYIYSLFGQNWLGLNGPMNKDSITDGVIEALTKKQ